MHKNSPESPKIGELGSNDDELFFGVHNVVLENIASLPSRVREITANALREAAQRPLGEYAKDFTAAVDVIRNHWWPPRP